MSADMVTANPCPARLPAARAGTQCDPCRTCADGVAAAQPRSTSPAARRPRAQPRRRPPLQDPPAGDDATACGDAADANDASPLGEASGMPPALDVYMLSPFRVFANDRAIDEWPNCKGKAIFKYLATHRGQPVAKEILMDVFWPDAEADAARNNLNVAIYGLRKALARADADYDFVLFRQGCYALNPNLRMWVDAEAFAGHLARARAAEQLGHTAAAMTQYRTALAIYQGPLLVEDRYESWLAPYRQRLRDSYVELLHRLAEHTFGEDDLESCTAVGARLLEVDNCDEQAHRLLMRCYSRLGQAHLALRQYHFCIDTLARELDLIPSPQTVALFQQIRRRQPV